MYFHTWLVISCGGEYLRFLSWDCSIGLDELSHYSPHGFNTKRKWCNVKEQYVFYISSENPSLDSSPDGYYFVWIYTLIWFFTEEVLNGFLYSRDTCRTPYEDYLIDITYTKTCILKSFLTRLNSTLY